MTPTEPFETLPDPERSNAVRAFSARLFIGKWREHREAAEFLDSQMRAHGEGVETLVRALLCYRDHLAAAADNTEGRQLALDEAA